MELLVKNKFGSLTGASKVLNENKEHVYKVKGSFGSNAFTKKYKKKIMTLDKKLLFTVCNKRIHGLFKRAAIIYDANKHEVARVTQNGAFKCGYQIEGTDKKMEIVGHFISSEGASVMYGGKKIGKIISGNYKQKGNMTIIAGLMDSFKLTFEDEKDGPFLVAVVVAIDNITDADQRQASKHGAPRSLMR